MPGFKPQTFNVTSDHSAKCATTLTLIRTKMLLLEASSFRPIHRMGECFEIRVNTLLKILGWT